MEFKTKSKTKTKTKRKRFNICLVSDFFYPRLGGVELHQYSLAQGLIKRGHKVIVLTGSYVAAKENNAVDDNSSDLNLRQGIRYMTKGLKVYYCPVMSVHSQASLPLFFSVFPIFRQIMLRENIDIVHGHQTTSALAHECMMHAKTMGIKAVYTDHSLFGFANAGSIHLNKLMKFSLSATDHVICVSHCQRENLVLRAYLDPEHVSVIPNAVDASKFTPDPSKAPDASERIHVVILSRLVYRKGIDLAAEIIPTICQRFPTVHFIIGGDGDKKLLLEEMIEKHQLQHRVEMLGSVRHTDVRDLLVRGHLFLNCSLTESFCIAILEAVCCGLFVVSTKVGGVPEVLPEHMIRFAEPESASIIEVLSEAIPLAKTVQPLALHAEIKDMYNWYDVAERTEKVYEKVMAAPSLTLFERLCKYHECGPWAGKIFCCMVALDYLFWCFLEWLFPFDVYEDRAMAFPYDRYDEMQKLF